MEVSRIAPQLSLQARSQPAAAVVSSRGGEAWMPPREARGDLGPAALAMCSGYGFQKRFPWPDLCGCHGCASVLPRPGCSRETPARTEGHFGPQGSVQEGGRGPWSLGQPPQRLSLQRPCLCSCKLRPRRAVHPGLAGWPWSACLPGAGMSRRGTPIPRGRGWSSRVGTFRGAWLQEAA